MRLIMEMQHREELRRIQQKLRWHSLKSFFFGTTFGFWLVEWLYSNDPFEQYGIWLDNHEKDFVDGLAAQKFYFCEWRSPFLFRFLDDCKWRINKLVAFATGLFKIVPF